MFILRDLLTPLQQQFSTTEQGQRRAVWFVYTLLAVVVPFTSSMTSNLLRALRTLFGLSIQAPAILCLHGQPHAALVTAVENAVGFDSRCCY